MLTEYIQAALRHGKYEILTDDGTYYGELPECPGVYANAKTLENWREELREVLDEWILFRVHRNLPLPTIDGTELAIREVA
ncbi:MAG: type II toxin-antitoxin system HicB family antitoxin [Thermodesulfobacteriota bacterium]